MRPSFTLSLLLSFSIAGANELRRSPIPGTNALRLALQHTPSSNVSLLFVDPGSVRSHLGDPGCEVDCGDNSCCPAGYYCDGIGCCPNGKTCGGITAGCADKNAVLCGIDFCCSKRDKCDVVLGCLSGGGSGGGGGGGGGATTKKKTTTMTHKTTATHTTVDIDTDFSFTVPALTTPSFVVPSFTVPSLTLPTFPDTIVISLPTNFPTALPNPALPDTTPVGSALSTRVGAGGWMCLSVGIMAGLLQLAF